MALNVQHSVTLQFRVVIDMAFLLMSICRGFSEMANPALLIKI